MNRRQLLYRTGIGLASGIAACAGEKVTSPSEEQSHPKMLDSGFSKDGNDLGARHYAPTRILVMNMVLPICLLFFLSGTIHAAALNDNPFMSAYATHDVAIDTDSQSKFWRNASSIYAEVDNYGHTIPGYRTQISSRWTKKYLYLLFSCPYEDLYLKPSPNAVQETYGLWNWDVAELFIGSDFQNIRRYKEFEVSPQREWIDLDINLDRPDHTLGWKWNSGFQVDARIDRDAKIWYGAMRIPFSALDQRPPVAGETFRVNLFRLQGPPGHRQSIAWKAPMNNTFHTPEKFGLLVLVKNKPG
jgi:hypothetical protein